LSSYGLIARRYDKSYKIDRRPASYHLTPLGLRYLREHGLNNAVLHARYKDSSVGQNFIDQHLSVVTGLLSIRKQFQDTFQFFTRYETHDQDDFIDPRPDLYLKRRETHPNKPDEVFVEFIPPHQQNWLTKKRIDEYIKHSEEEGWKTDTYPAILFYVISQNTVEILQAYATKKKDELYIEDEELSLSCLLYTSDADDALTRSHVSAAAASTATTPGCDVVYSTHITIQTTIS